MTKFKLGALGFDVALKVLEIPVPLEQGQYEQQNAREGAVRQVAESGRFGRVFS